MTSQSAGSGGRPTGPYRPQGSGGRSGGGRSGGAAGGRRGGRPRYFRRRKVCSFCVDHIDYIDYKDVDKFRRYVTDRFKIESRRKTGVCTKHQRGLSTAIKRARHIALIPISPDHYQVGVRGSR